MNSARDTKKQKKTANAKSSVSKPHLNVKVVFDVTN